MKLDAVSGLESVVPSEKFSQGHICVTARNDVSSPVELSTSVGRIARPVAPISLVSVD